MFLKTSLESLPDWFREIAPILAKVNRSIAGSFSLWTWQALTAKQPSWKPSDVDIWFSSKREKDFYRTIVETWINVQDQFPGALMKKRGPAIVEIRLRDDLPTLQFIMRNAPGDSPGCFLDLFDLSVAQVAMDFGLTCEAPLFGDVNFTFADDLVRSDIASGTSRYFRDLDGDKVQKRIDKYEGRGFQITQGEIRDLKPWGVYDYETDPK